MVDVENDYFVKDGLVEDLIEELVVEFGEDDGSDSDQRRFACTNIVAFFVWAWPSDFCG